MHDGDRDDPRATTGTPPSKTRGVKRSAVIERLRERLRLQQAFGPPRPVRCACCGR